MAASANYDYMVVLEVHSSACAVFSSARSPVTKRPLMNHNFGGTSALRSPMTSVYQTTRSLGEYHMSRQSPDVLDQMYSSSGAADNPDNPTHQFHHGDPGGIIEPSYPPAVDRSALGRLNGHASAVIHRRGNSPQLSYLRQLLNSRRSQSPSPSSLVQLAARSGVGVGVGVRRGGGRLLRRHMVGGSPAVVKLAGVGRTSSEGEGERERGEGNQQQQQPQQLTNGLEERPRNPCDKEVVLSALRQRR